MEKKFIPLKELEVYQLARNLSQKGGEVYKNIKVKSQKCNLKLKSQNIMLAAGVIKLKKKNF